MEEEIKKIVDNAIRKGYSIYDINDKSSIGYIETIYDLKENMVVSFKVEIPNPKHENTFMRDNFINYKVKVVSFELEAVKDLDRDYETMSCYVEVISKENSRW